MFGYRIREGVRRCVAALAAGKTDIPAVVIVPGRPDQPIRLRLDQLFSPKSEVPRDPRYIRDVEYPTAVLGTEPPAIAVSPILSLRRQQLLTPVAQVKLV